MKITVTLTCFAATLALTYGTICGKAKDCGEEECCVTLSIVALRMISGICLKLSKEGQICSEPDSRLRYFGGKYLFHCPCQQGLSCRSKDGKEKNTNIMKYLSSLRCQKETIEQINEDEITENEMNSKGIVQELTTKDTGNPEINEKLSEEIAEGPGGEPPRDDDCENWEYPC